MNRLSSEKRAQVITALIEGSSINSTVRMTGVAQMTILKLIADVGAACSDIQDRWFRNLTCNRVQLDEIWSFVGMKAKNVPNELRGTFGFGDVWTWVAIDADTKLVITWLVADRSQTSAALFTSDLASRIVGKVQVSSDGYAPYNLVIPSAFGKDVNYGQVVKVYGEPAKEDRSRYSPSRFVRAERHVKIGNPDEKFISTSFVERNNLTMRMSNRRMTRLTNAFSKKVENHAHQHAINFAYYNLCRIHRTLRCTPAMEAGITSTAWKVSDLIYIADEYAITKAWDLRGFIPPHPHVA